MLYICHFFLSNKNTTDGKTVNNLTFKGLVLLAAGGHERDQRESDLDGSWEQVDMNGDNQLVAATVGRNIKVGPQLWFDCNHSSDFWTQHYVARGKFDDGCEVKSQLQ